MAEGNSGIQQMAMLMLNPQFAAQQQKFALQQQLAQKMMEEGAAQPPNNQLANPGGQVVVNSPLGGAARGIQQALGAYMANKNIDNQIAAYKNMGQGANTTPEDPNAPSITDKLTSLLYGDKLGAAGYETRVAGAKAGAEAFGKAPATPLILPNGTVVPLSNIVGNGAPTQSSQPLPPAVKPSFVQQGTPDGNTAMGDIFNAQPDPAATTGNVMPNPTVNTPSVINPNSPEGAANAAGLKAGAVKYGETAADTQKNLDAMTSKLPLVLSRLDTMEKAAKDASFGYGVDNNGEGAKQDIHDQLGDKTAKANNTLLQLSAQGVLPELGPQLQGMKGNKFLESLAASSSGLNMKAPPEAKASLIQGLRNNYIGMIKSTAQQMRDMGQKAPSDAEIDAMVAKNAPQQIPSGVTHVWTPQGIKPIGGQ